jgi:Amt family ammonium transporter
VVSWVALFVIDKLVGGLRVSVEEETMGLDQSSHGESGYNS